MVKLISIPDTDNSRLVDILENEYIRMLNKEENEWNLRILIGLLIDEFQKNYVNSFNPGQVKFLMGTDAQMQRTALYNSLGFGNVGDPLEYAKNLISSQPGVVDTMGQDTSNNYLEFGISPTDVLRSILAKYDLMRLSDGAEKSQYAFQIMFGIRALKQYLEQGRLIDKVKGVIFDLDGTLVDSTAVHDSAWKRATKELGISLDADVGIYLGTTTETAAKQILSKGSESEIRELVNLKRKYSAEGGGDVVIFDGVLDVLSELKRVRKSVAICTAGSKERVEKVLETTELGNYFSKGNLVRNGMYRSPRPTAGPINTTLKMMQLRRNQVFYVDDSFLGFLSAYSAKTRFVYFSPNEGSPEEKRIRDYPRGKYQMIKCQHELLKLKA